MTSLFISDLHLEESRPDIAAIFIKFLEKKLKNTTSLYILGDFFEAWIGDDDLTDFNQQIIQALRKVTLTGYPIYFLHGNRDFLLGKKFFKATGCKLLPDEKIIRVGNQEILIMHGDTLCSEDKAYLKFRKKSRNWLIQKLFLRKSLQTRQKIAADMREKSKAYTSTASEKIMDVTQAEVARVMQKHNVSHLIHGHTHRPAIHQFLLSNKLMTRTVLAPWHDNGSVLKINEDGRNELIVLD